MKLFTKKSVKVADKKSKPNTKHTIVPVEFEAKFPFWDKWICRKIIYVR